MIKRLVFMLTLTSFLISLGYPNVVGNQNASSIAPYGTVLLASPELKGAFNDIVEDFSLYSIFISTVYPAGPFYVSEYGETYEEACCFFSQGFEPDMIKQMLEAYTCWDPQLGKLCIIPCDGMPVLEIADEPYTAYYYQDDHSLIFEKYFRNCYEINDCYLFRVTAIRGEERWKIKDMTWHRLYESVF